jgi:hypothetical protein
VVASDGRQVVAAAANEPFDVMLMDVQMREMDGLEDRSQWSGMIVGSQGLKPPSRGAYIDCWTTPQYCHRQVSVPESRRIHDLISRTRQKSTLFCS